MTTAIIIGNIISFGAAVFTVLSSLSKTRGKIYGYQTAQCLIMALASIFFASPSGIVTFLLCTIRNFLLAKDRFTTRMCIIFSVFAIILGTASNTRGIIGLLPVFATVTYTFGCLLTRKTVSIKLNMLINLVLWSVYDFCILDLISGGVDTVTAGITVLALISAFRTLKKE